LIDQVKKNEMGGACGTYGGEERRNRVLVAKLEGKRSIVRPRHRWENTIKMYL
jgi:hypothetical protein